MKIECIVVSVFYGDYLYYTLPTYSSFFDRVLVVTCEEDIVTQEVCKKNGVEFRIDNHKDDGAILKKGHMINNALSNELKINEWVLLTDADIFFEKNIKIDIEQEFDDKPHYTKDNLYGAYRRHCPSFIDFVKYLSDPEPSRDWSRYEDPILAKKRTVFGFFQLFHSAQPDRFRKFFVDRKEGTKRYPTMSNGASHDDYYFQKHKAKQFLSIDTVHLSDREINWEGRVTEDFDIIEADTYADLIDFFNKAAITDNVVTYGNHNSGLDSLFRNSEFNPSLPSSLLYMNYVDAEASLLSLDLVKRGGILFGEVSSDEEYRKVVSEINEKTYCRVGMIPIDDKIIWWIIKI